MPDDWVDDEIGRMSKEIVMAYFEVLPQHMHVGTELTPRKTLELPRQTTGLSHARFEGQFIANGSKFSLNNSCYFFQLLTYQMHIADSLQPSFFPTRILYVYHTAVCVHI